MDIIETLGFHKNPSYKLTTITGNIIKFILPETASKAERELFDGLCAANNPLTLIDCAENYKGQPEKLMKQLAAADIDIETAEPKVSYIIFLKQSLLTAKLTKAEIKRLIETATKKTRA
jgi:hypothetical protein